MDVSIVWMSTTMSSPHDARRGLAAAFASWDATPTCSLAAVSYGEPLLWTKIVPNVPIATATRAHMKALSIAGWCLTATAYRRTKAAARFQLAAIRRFTSPVWLVPTA